MPVDAAVTNLVGRPHGMVAGGEGELTSENRCRYRCRLLHCSIAPLLDVSVAHAGEPRARFLTLDRLRVSRSQMMVITVQASPAHGARTSVRCSRECPTTPPSACSSRQTTSGPRHGRTGWPSPPRHPRTSSSGSSSSPCPSRGSPSECACPEKNNKAQLSALVLVTALLATTLVITRDAEQPFGGAIDVKSTAPADVEDQASRPFLAGRGAHHVPCDAQGRKTVSS